MISMNNYLEEVLKEGEKSLYHDRYAKVYRILYLILNILLQPILIVVFFFSLNKDDVFSILMLTYFGLPFGLPHLLVIKL